MSENSEVKKGFEKKLIQYLIGSAIPYAGDAYLWWKYDDIGALKVIVGGLIPGPFITDLVYFLGGREEDEEESPNQNSENYRENGQSVATDGGQNSGNQGNSNRTVGNNGVGIDQGVYEDLSMDNPKGRLNSLTQKIPFGKKALLVVAAVVAAVGGFFMGGPILTLGGLAAVGSVYGVYSKWGVKGLMFGALPVLALVGLVAVTGVGAGYGGLINDMFGSYATGLDDLGGEISYQAGQAWKTITCFGNAGCIREWQLNQTRQPGSEDTGETYRLRVQNLMVSGQDNGVDIAYQRKDAPIPVYFLLKNTRHGLKGIKAKDVKYRLKVRNDQLVSQNDVLCSTKEKPDANSRGWIPLNKFPEGSSIPDEFDRNTLLPGEPVSPLNYNGENQLTLKECGLLQPGPSESVTFVLQIKYQYSSQSTLPITAMSRDHRRAENIPIEFKRSKTADTPVETFIQARKPILFQDFESGRRPIPFQTRIGVSTDDRNIRYRIDVNKFKMQDSSKTTHLKSKGSCSDLNYLSNNKYEFSEEVKDRIQRMQLKGGWWSKRNPPPPASCTFTLANNGKGISPTGETLTMSAEVEYTVKQEPEPKTFKISNTICTTRNCPRVVPLKPEELTQDIATSKLGTELTLGEKGYWTKEYAHCGDHQDAQSGCSVISSFKLKDRTGEASSSTTIRNGDLALKLDRGLKGKGNNFYTCYVRNKLAASKFRVISISESQLERVWSKPDRALNYSKGSGNDGWVETDITRSDPQPDNGCKIPGKKTSSSGGGSSSSSGTSSQTTNMYQY
ncbi:MAG: hypothetical protein ABEK16_00900 [Candidatus Nanohalobium sp.]